MWAIRLNEMMSHEFPNLEMEVILIITKHSMYKYKKKVWTITGSQYAGCALYQMMKTMKTLGLIKKACEVFSAYYLMVYVQGYLLFHTKRTCVTK